MRVAVIVLCLLFPRLVGADGFPVNIRHAFGETVVPERPQRIVSVGYHEQDFLYSLGLAPVGVHEWFGGFPFATWPWADQARQAVGAKPSVQHGFEIDAEWVLSLEPDLIVATFSPMDSRTYQMLSRIAPVVAAPSGYPAWGAPWEDELRLIGQATGREERAETVIAQISRQISAATDQFPQLSNQSGTAAHYAGGQIVGYQTDDGANRLLSLLGIKTPPAFDDLAGPGGNFGVSVEQTGLFDRDVVVWLVDAPSRAKLEGLPHFQAMNLEQEGRSIWADKTMMGAMSFQSPLSIAWVLERLPAMLAAAVDGDPATKINKQAQ